MRGRAVKLGFTFPPEASFLRKEIHEKILRENIEAARAGEALVDAKLDTSEISARLGEKPKS
ncbi:MAG: hypothetical protein EXQ99_06890 [Alphaproteobacteria bacterium]|nr:hypothetical protein [Alphaproteobacteria bacterium]